MLEDRIVERVLTGLTADERAGIVYLARPLASPGTRLNFPRLAIDVLRPSWLAFIDGTPDRDWGHPCRYLLIDDETGEIQSYPAQFPPFPSAEPWIWRVIQQPPSLPGTAALR